MTDRRASDLQERIYAYNGFHEQPGVSVVIPTRGRELLSRALESIFSQSYTGKIECVVVLDAEKGESLQLPELPATSSTRSINIVSNSRKKGLAGARNTGILAASNELVAFCDDDDEWLSHKLSTQVTALSLNPGASGTSCGIYVRYRGRDVIRSSKISKVTFQNLLRSRMVDINSSTFLTRQSALVGPIGLTDEQLPGSYAEDYDLLLRAARVGPIQTVAEPLARIYWHRASFFAGRWDMIIEALEYLLAKHPEFKDDPPGLARIYGQIAFAHAAAGRREEGRRWAKRAISLNTRQPRAYLALLVSTGLIPSSLLLNILNHCGRGV